MVSAQFQFGHGVDIGDVELEGRTGRGARYPNVQVLFLARFEENHRRAALQIGDLVEQGAVGLGVQFAVRLAVWYQLEEVLHEVTEAERDAATTEDERFLLVSEGGGGLEAFKNGGGLKKGRGEG